jgi:hypothetical protein
VSAFRRTFAKRIVMTRTFAVVVVSAACLVVTSAQPSAPQVTYLDSEKFAALAAKGGALASGPDFTASLARRDKPGQVEIHTKETDIFYILDAAPRSSPAGR